MLSARTSDTSVCFRRPLTRGRRGGTESIVVNSLRYRSMTAKRPPSIVTRPQRPGSQMAFGGAGQWQDEEENNGCNHPRRQRAAKFRRLETWSRSGLRVAIFPGWRKNILSFLRIISISISCRPKHPVGTWTHSERPSGHGERRRTTTLWSSGLF